MFDFCWSVYDGEFKNGKPDGTGTMKYSDYTYVGEFKNGVEHGKGVITYKNHKIEKTLFIDGKKSI